MHKAHVLEGLQELPACAKAMPPCRGTNKVSNGGRHMSNPYFARLGLRASNGGLGVFVNQWIPANTRILEFGGTRISRALVNQAIKRNKPDSYLQIAENEFLGPSGHLDDYINHSCEPNCGLEFSEGRVFLKSIRDISFGTELTFDYSTSQSNYPYWFTCHCGHAKCRRDIGDFSELARERKSYYISRGIVAPFLIEEREETGNSNFSTIYKFRYHSPVHGKLVRH